MSICGKGIVVPGTALELTVVSGSSRPTDPQPNTIWIKTENVIERVCFGPEWNLEDHRVGDIWVDTSNQCKGEENEGLGSTTRILNLSFQPYVTINVLQINRWDGMAWNACEGSIFANDRWSDVALYLFYNGTHNSVYPLYVGNTNAASNKITLNSQPEYSADLMLVENGTAFGYSVLTTQDMTGIEVDSFEAMGLKYRVVSGSVNTNRFFAGLSSTVNSNIAYNTADDMQSLQLAVSNEVQEVSMPINCSGVLRPTIKFQCSGSVPFALEIYYWVLN